MEKKKLLLVAVSVGVVLFIIISIPLLIVSPRQNPTPSSQERFSAVEAPKIPQQIATPQQVEATQATPQAAPEAAPQAVVSSALGNTQSVQSPLPETVVETRRNEIAPSSPAEPPQVTTITVQAPRTVAVPSTPAARAQEPAPAKPSQPAPAATPAKTAVAPAKPAPAVKEAPKPVAPAPAAKPRVEPSKPANNDYWVQTGAFSTQVRAEGAKESLASKGIASVIENRDIDGKTWYRVRVGPYVSETEAGYWLALVKAIDGFGDSQIRQNPRL